MRWARRCCEKGTRRMIVIMIIGATMTMLIVPRLPILNVITAEPPMTGTQTSKPTVNYAVDETCITGAATTGSQECLRSSSTLSPDRRSAPSFILVS